MSACSLYLDILFKVAPCSSLMPIKAHSSNVKKAPFSATNTCAHVSVYRNDEGVRSSVGVCVTLSQEKR